MGIEVPHTMPKAAVRHRRFMAVTRPCRPIESLPRIGNGAFKATIVPCRKAPVDGKMTALRVRSAIMPVFSAVGPYDFRP